MSKKELFVGNTSLKQQAAKVEGNYVSIDGEDFYKISHFNLMRPFFISLVSPSDHWLFISTTGGLSAGRKNEHSSLFPYYTDDKISESYDTTGSKTMFKVQKEGKLYLWEPFSNRYEGVYQVKRNLYKNFAGCKLIFEEENADLGLKFQYSWLFSEKYGIVKKSTVKNLNADGTVEIEVLDGIQNILPYGVNAGLQNERSNLANAYKKNELDSNTGLGMFMLSSMIVDKAEPSEALKATTVWNAGTEYKNILLSSAQLDKFRQGFELENEVDIKAESGSYFINSDIHLSANDSSSWYIVAEVNQDHTKVIDLIQQLSSSKDALINTLQEDIESATQSLLDLVGKSDGLQLTGNQLSFSRHYSNVLFNIMRGGIFEDHYLVEKNDLLDYVKTINRKLLASKSTFFDQLEDSFGYQELIDHANKTADQDIIRICYEYLPLSFSRRHGDPSRPWNRFSIENRKEDGSVNRNYQGNWRDIFQNWEALSLSFPTFIFSMISKFVNASTIDGYNPYRITREGIDWEVIEPDDPWSYIGYWGDHQIIYLQKLLEVANNHNSDQLAKLLTESFFVYANVPYKIKSYVDIVKNPQDTIDFDEDLENVIEARANDLGGDGKLVFGKDDSLCRASLTEKLMVTLLAKLSNFIPEAGIWLNTQRPEWNDANNALVGNGVSMVTLYYMRRFVAFMSELYAGTDAKSFELNAPVTNLFNGISNVFQANEQLLSSAFSDEDRRQFVDQLGELGETYREIAYNGFNGDTSAISLEQLQAFFKLTLQYLDHSIKANKREDGLYHAYNLAQFEENKINIDYLYEMLEGQVAVLSAGVLNLEEVLEIMDALKSSKIYRENQYSYMLYPNRELPRFLDKNFIPEEFAKSSKLIQTLEQAGNTALVQKDGKGNYHFNGTFNNAGSIVKALDSLEASNYSKLVSEEREAILDVFEQMFNHKAFTGRSGTFFGYEGLGSIYWHMVSKLLVAVQENIYWGRETYKNSITMGKMIDYYYEIRAGIGVNKTPDLYGSFPTDPYSHTPGNKGVQQPGMTGQVKEDILNRWSELGVMATDSCISFDPIFLSEKEFLKDRAVFHYFDVKDEPKSLNLEVDELGFTYCQVPIIYKKSSSAIIKVHFNDGKVEELDGKTLSKAISSDLFNRTGSVQKIEVNQTFNS